MKSGANDLLTSLLASEEVRQALAKTGPRVLETISRLAPSTQSGTSQRADPATPPQSPTVTRALVAAAVRYNFDPTLLDGDPAARDRALSQSSLISVGGTKLLRLSNAERTRILDSPEIQELLPACLAELEQPDEVVIGSTHSSPEALIDAYLREMLRGRLGTGPQGWPPQHYRAIKAARDALEGVARLAPSVPSVNDCRRQAGLTDLLSPLGVMIGLDEASPQGRTDRFAGRAEELEILRSIVDELDSESAVEYVSRAAIRVGAAVAQAAGVRRPRMLTIKARGGLGKTALIAKFIHDHATAANRKFPFAFLDFDRADLQPRSPGLLIIEIARQLALQYAAQEPALEQLQNSIRRSLTGQEFTMLGEWCDALRAIVRDALAASNARTFLLVLDTLEIVDADPEAMNGTITLLRFLTEAPFPELCVVASGRSGLDELENPDAPQFSVKTKNLEPLSIADAREMVDKLGRQLMGSEWKDEWVPKIAGRRRDPAARREPLTLRLAVELVRDASPEQREPLVKEIQLLGEKADQEFVGVLYERRVLDHIRDKQARKLAWPGLVARTVTRQLASDVLAPICELTPEQAGQAFDSLSREGWIVEPFGHALRHRRDLRARTLPLMRRKPEKFDKVVDALIDYYGVPPNDDPVERAYYIFLRGRTEEIRPDAFPEQVLTALARDLEDFEPGSPGWCLLEAKFSERPLELEHLRRLPDDLLWDHVGRTGSGLRGMNDRKIEPRVRFLLDKGQPSTGGTIGAHSAWQAIQMKCGFWGRLDPRDLVMPAEQYDLTQLAFYIARLSLAGQVAPDYWLKKYQPLYDRITGSRGNDNWHALAQALLTAHMYDPGLATRIDSRIRDALASSSGQGRLRECSLRLILLVGAASRRSAITAWCKLEAARIANGISFAEFAILASSGGAQCLSAPNATVLDYLDDAERLRYPLEDQQFSEIPHLIIQNLDVIAAARQMIEWVALQDDDWVARFAGSYCFVREPEWIVPFAYLLDKVLPKAWRMNVNLPADAYDPEASGLFKRLTTTLLGAQTPSDLLGFLGWADRAGDFGRTVNLLGRLLRGGEASELGALMAVRDASRARLRELQSRLQGSPAN
ncbi:hypothetical protein MesoLjLc_46080 [Mesorhizobium sp. L-8-10]|uniref:hypothetical protein n=1 Tax=Mesorhizobium sp. L-8-10 TaxID=2744523 RepID=UPI001927D1C9|nr:hypothetical protein [Mesorhizobium sp. L-8-10]BCH32678.1 hypothetical protein MesoLjLc_46080 [Mesorhizobium sp. L-8-10]